MTSRSPLTPAVLLAATAIAAGTTACSSPRPSTSRSTDAPGPTTTASPPPAPSTSTTAGGSAPPGGMQTGNYADGAAGVPHYVVDVTSSTSSSVAGSITFIYQDGRTADVGTFSGTAGGGRAMLTIAPQGTQASATYTSTTLVLENCTSYLQYAATAAQCTFNSTSSSPG